MESLSEGHLRRWKVLKLPQNALLKGDSSSVDVQLIWTQRPKHFEHGEQLIAFSFSLKKRLLCVKLGQYASSG